MFVKVETFLSLPHSASIHVRGSEFDSIKILSEEGKHFLTEGLDSCPLFLGIWCFHGKSTGVVCTVFLRAYDQILCQPLLRDFSHHSEWCWGFMVLAIKSSIHLSFWFHFVFVPLNCEHLLGAICSGDSYHQNCFIGSRLLLIPVAYHCVCLFTPLQVDGRREKLVALGGFVLALGLWRGVSWPPCSRYGSHLACCFLFLTWMFRDTGAGVRGMRASCAPQHCHL